MLTVSHLTKRYTGRSVVNSVSFDAKPGEVIGVLGPNGAGKTTTMRMIAGVLEPDTGSVIINGHDVWQQRRSAQAQLGYLPEGAPLWGEMTARTYLGFLADARSIPAPKRKTAIDRVVGETALGAVFDQPIETLSKGLRRRVALAGTLLHEPPVLLLDEPTDGLDPTQKQATRALIKSLSEGRVILISTHMLEEIDALCCRVLVMARGQLQADETPAAFAARSPSGRLNDAFEALTAPQ